MTTTINEQARNAVNDFLQSQIDKKTEKEQRQLEKARQDEDQKLINELEQLIADVKQKHQLNTWIPDAVNRMVKQLNFGTHISKGIHPDAKGDNVSFMATANLPSYLVGTHSINSTHLDANGNAAALPLAGFFNHEIAEGSKIRDLIVTDNADFISSLALDASTAKNYHQAFKKSLQNTLSKPVTHERNKQVLWATNPYTAQSLADTQYITLIPLYPSVFTYEVYLKINELRYSDANKLARDNRFKVNAEQQPYVSMPDLATVQLGGTKPQNVSQLMSKQGGRNYLLPSLPPKLEQKNSFSLSKFSQNIFDSKNFKFQMRHDIDFIFSVIKDSRNNVDIRDKRKDAIDRILHKLFAIAQQLQTAMPVGWSKDYQLVNHQKLWLDPRRADLANEAQFAQDYATTAWQDEVINDFANWLNVVIREEFQALKFTIGDSEHIEWQREIDDMRKRYERLGKGVFA